MQLDRNKPTGVKVLIVDDEKKACTNIINLLSEYVDADIHVCDVAYSTAEAEIAIKKHSPDALFLDIEMPNENAFQFLERIQPFDFEVIFVTAFDEYAIRAFRLNALDYILKPISIIELRNAVVKLTERIKYKKILENSISYIELSNQVANKVKQQKITLKDGISIEVVDFKDILFVEAQSSYSRIVFIKSGFIKEMTMSNPLTVYEELLPPEIFYRIHRSYLVNCQHIKKIVSDDSNNVLIGQHTLPIGRRRFISFIEFLKNNKYYNG